MTLTKTSTFFIWKGSFASNIHRSFGTVNKSATSVTKRYPPSCQKERQVQVFGSVWEKYKGLGFKRYQDAPSHGVVMPARYFDTGDVLRSTSSVPTAVLIHGSPGSVDHFSTLVDTLTENGIRVIVPSLPHPNFTFFECKHYRHSPPEKADFVKAILQEESVKKMDCLISHSSGTFVNMELNQDPHAPDIKSVALFHAIGDETPGVMKPYWFIRASIKMSQNPLLRNTLLDRVCIPILRMSGNPFAKKGTGEALWGGFSMHYYNRSRVFEGLKKIAHQKKPCMIVVADNDAVLSQGMNTRLLSRAFDFDVETEADVYDSDFKLERSGHTKDSNRYLSVIRCRKGGHFAFLKHDKIVNQATLKLIQSVQKPQLMDVMEEIPFRRQSVSDP